MFGECAYLCAFVPVPHNCTALSVAMLKTIPCITMVYYIARWSTVFCSICVIRSYKIILLHQMRLCDTVRYSTTLYGDIMILYYVILHVCSFAGFGCCAAVVGIEAAMGGSSVGRSIT